MFEPKKCSLKECLSIEDDKKFCSIFIPTMTPLLKPNSKDCPYYAWDKKKVWEEYMSNKSKTNVKKGRGSSLKPSFKKNK